MGVLKWAALGVVAAGFVGVKLLDSHTAFFIDSTMVENTKYLIDRYKAAPTRTASLIKRHTSACLVERLGKENAADLENFFGEIMVYTVRNVEKDRQAFMSGYEALAERDGPAIDARISSLPKAQKQRLAALVDDLADGPHAMVGCVATKLRVAA